MVDKRTEVAKGYVSHGLKQALRERVHELGTNESDYINTLLEINLLGIDHAIRVAVNRIQRVANAGASTSPEPAHHQSEATKSRTRRDS